jgi:uncharacterized Zn ribbon protein
MSRRVGNFVNPQTGEDDWLEPDTVELIVLQPTMVTRVSETVQTPIDFKLSNDDANHVIALSAKYTANGTTYSSNPVSMDEEEFANQFAQQVYSDKALDEAEIVKQAKNTAVQDLSRRLMDNNVLIGGMKLKGLGFVIVEGDKVMTIDELEFEYTVENSHGIKTVVLKNCVGNASLQNLANPFYNLLACGCNVNRDMIRTISASGLCLQSVKTGGSSLLISGFYLSGIATKTGVPC